VATGSLRLGAVRVDGATIYWTEGRPTDGGRSALVARAADGRLADVTPSGVDVRTRVHEYGGGAYTVHGGRVYYTELADQRVYSLDPAGGPTPLTPPGPYRYADLVVDPVRNRLLALREDYARPGLEPEAALVGIPLPAAPRGSSAASASSTTTGVEVLASGDDFYAAPRLSPDGSTLAWLAWRHPQMPWDGTELWVAAVLPDGALGPRRLVAGGDRESIFQPEWSPDGTLYFVSDRTGWWNLYRLADGIEPLCPMDAEFGRPLWLLGTTTYAFADPQRIVVTYAQGGRWHLALLQLATGTLRALASDLEPGDSVAATNTHAVLLAGSPRTPDAVVRVDLATGAAETIRPAASLPIDPRALSAPESIEFETEGGRRAFAFFYRPSNPDFAPLPGEHPPLLVVAHGGPTAMATSRLNLEIQYWTSRGFAVVDVNYGGSTGYGRAYRERLDGAWGVVDVADCVNAARHLVDRGEVDPDRLIARGRSAGGYTTLAALAFRPGVFRAGASYYGIADLERMARDTHTFESRYLDRLVGPYPEAAARYRARSPIHFADRLACPVIFFQGLEDRVVPPDQSERMAAAVRARGLMVALVALSGEQHGFRRAESIARCLEAELFFYGAVLGFAPPEAPPLHIDNRPGSRPALIAGPRGPALPGASVVS